MRTLALLFTILCLPVWVAQGQETDAPEGAIIDTAEVSGFPLDTLSPGLIKDINELVGTPLRAERLNQLASRIEDEQPEVVAAFRSVARPDGRARVVFLVARISDDTGLTENINARYIVESVEIGGAPSEVSSQLRDDLQKLVGKRLDNNEANRLNERLEDELPGREVKRRISKGSRAGTIRVIFDVIEEPWLLFAPMRSKIVYHEDHGWSGVLDIPLSDSRARHRFTAGLVFDNNDDLVEEYSGFRLRFESREIGTKKFGASLEFSRLNQSWEEATLAALASTPSIPGAYRTRVTVEPTATFAFSPGLRVNAGVSLSELESLTQSPLSQTANAWVFGVSGDNLWETPNGGRQTAAASYGLRAGSGSLDSDLGYRRHLVRARYQFDYEKSTILAGFSYGYISGEAPLFERFTLGDTSTLRGWNKYDIAPAGGDRMFHQSLEFRLWHVGAFFDVGSVWDRSSDAKTRYSTGFGAHSDNGFLTFAFPLNTDNGGGLTFMAGVRF
jgi:hypothetical protein